MKPKFSGTRKDDVPFHYRRATDRYLPFMPYVLALLLVLTLMVGVLATVALENAKRSSNAAREARDLATKVEAVRRQNEARSVRRATGQCLRVQVLRSKQVNYLEASQFYTDYIISKLGTSTSVVFELGTLKDGYANTGPTNCEQAVSRPLNYRPPEPRKMTLKVACDTIAERFKELGEPQPHLRYCKER